MTRSRLKLPGFCRGGNSLKLCNHLATQAAAVTNESDVAAAVWRAANDHSGQLRYPAGADAVALAQSE